MPGEWYKECRPSKAGPPHFKSVHVAHQQPRGRGDIDGYALPPRLRPGLPSGSRLACLVGHPVGQGSYYPLFPPAPGVPLDMTKSREWEIPISPDMLIVPSRLGYIWPALVKNILTNILRPNKRH